jgi:hypothetical protein
MPDEPAAPQLPEQWKSVAAGSSSATALLAELRREVGPGHVLGGRNAKPVARCTGCDDVVFRLLDDDTFAIVHLTWSGRPEAPPWPATQVLPTFMALELVVESHSH